MVLVNKGVKVEKVMTEVRSYFQVPQCSKDLFPHLGEGNTKAEDNSVSVVPLPALG